MGDWYIVRGNMYDGCHKYNTKVIVYAVTVNEAKSKAKKHLETDADCLFTPTDVSRLDKDVVY